MVEVLGILQLRGLHRLCRIIATLERLLLEAKALMWPFCVRSLQSAVDGDFAF